MNLVVFPDMKGIGFQSKTDAHVITCKCHPALHSRNVNMSRMKLKNNRPNEVGYLFTANEVMCASNIHLLTFGRKLVGAGVPWLSLSPPLSPIRSCVWGDHKVDINIT